MAKLSNRVARMGLPMTIEMAKKSRALAAQGNHVVNLSLGEPDFDTPSWVKEAAIEAIQNNHSHYTPVPGIPELRAAIAAKLYDENELDYSPSQIIVSTGAKQSIANAILALVNPGDEVIVPAPYWVSYVDLVEFADGIVVSPVSDLSTGFKMTPDQLRAACTEKTRLLIFSSPNNPSGAVYSPEELEGLATVLRDFPHVFVLADEIYEYIRYQEPYVSLASLPGMKDRVGTVNGLSKGFAMTGWRLGYLAAPQDVADACEKIQSQFTSATSSITQHAAVAALRTRRADVSYMTDAFTARRALFFSALSRIPGLKMSLPEGAFYLFADVSAYLEPNGFPSATELCLHLLETAYVSSVPGDAFGLPGYIRWSFAASSDDLEEAGKRLTLAFATLRHA
jgi:aspartate aminotransferase